MADKFWKKVTIDVQSALATAQTITAIQKTNPAVVTHDGATLTEGNYVLFDVSGMTELNNRVGRATNPSASPSEFQIDELDASLYGTFTEGSFQVITFGTSLNNVTAISFSGGEAETDDVSIVHSDQRIEVPTVKSPFVGTFEAKWEPGNTGLTALQAASDASSPRAFRITFSDNSRFTFYGYVSFGFLPTGDFPNLVRTGFTIRATGLNTVLSD